MPKKLINIAFLNLYQGASNRGAERFVDELSKRLSKNYSVVVLANGENPQKRLPIVWRFYLDPFGLQTLLGTLKLIPKLWKGKYSFVISVNGGWQPAIVRVVTWLYGGKMIISGQSGIGWDDRNNLWCFPDSFVALSSKALYWAKKANPFIKSVKIPNGVDIEKFQISKTQNIKIKKIKTVLAVGAFVKEKRLDLAIKAVAKLKDVKLLIVGSGGELKSELAELGIGLLGRQRFQTKSVPFEEMPNVYYKADVFTLPSSESEAFGNVLVEAMACSLPVVATNDPIRREITGNAGLFVDPKDIDSYASSLEKALSTDWGDKPRKQAEKFSWNNIAVLYENLFKNLSS